jgi:hypothetical protein
VFNFDFSTHVALLPDNGINPFPTSTLSTLSKVVVSLFTKPSLISNRFYHVADGVLTQQNIFLAVEKETGVAWTRSSFSTKDVRQSAYEKMQQGVFGPQEFLHSLMTPFFGGIQVWTHVDNEMFGIQFGDVDLHKELAKVVKQLL